MKENAHKTAVPFSRILARARIVFAILIALVIASVSSSVVLGWKSGEFRKHFIVPFESAVNDFYAGMLAEDDEKPTSPSGSWKKYVDTTPTPQTKRGTSGTTRIIIVTPKTQSGTSAYEEQVRKMNQDAAAAKAAQDAWWNEQQQNFDATKQENDAWFEAAKAQQQQDMLNTQQEFRARFDAQTSGGF